MATFVDAQAMQSGVYGATIKNTKVSQRDKLENTLLNLADALGIEKVSRLSTADSGMMYAMPGELLQSASNTILSMSERLAQQSSSRRK